MFTFCSACVLPLPCTGTSGSAACFPLSGADKFRKKADGSLRARFDRGQGVCLGAGPRMNCDEMQSLYMGAAYTRKAGINQCMRCQYFSALDPHVCGCCAYAYLTCPHCMCIGARQCCSRRPGASSQQDQDDSVCNRGRHHHPSY